MAHEREEPGFVVTKARIGLIAACLGLLGAVGGGIARAELAAVKLADVDTRTVKLEGAQQVQALQIQAITTSLQDEKDSLNRIEDAVGARRK